MNIKITVALTVLLVGGVMTAFGDWRWGTNSVAEVWLYYHPADNWGTTLEDVIEDLKNADTMQRLTHVRLDHIQAYDARFQKELCAELEKLAPRQFAEAKRSSGNIHNPKILALHEFFGQAVLATPTVQNINAKLAPFGRQATEASRGEKLYFVRNDGQLHFRCYFWLRIENATGIVLAPQSDP